MTKLDAVKKLMTKAGANSPDELNTGGRSWVGYAEQILDECELEVQQMPWHYNTRDDVTLTPASDDRIALPQGTLRIDSYGRSLSVNVTPLGAFLFDVENNRDTFTGGIQATYAIRYEFSCIPLFVQEYIVAKAAYEFCIRWTKRGELVGGLLDNIEIMRTKAMQANGDARESNVLETEDARDMRGRYRHPIFGRRW